MEKRRLIYAILLSVGQRLLSGALVLLFIIFMSFFGLEMARGTAFQPAASGAVVKTVAYLGKVAQGDLGLTAAGSITLRPLPIAEVLPSVLARSLGLMIAALLVAAPVGVMLGIWAARGRHSNWSLLTLLLSIVGVSLPSFFAALLLQVGVIQLTRLSGRTVLPVGGFGWDLHLLLPALVLAARPLAQMARVTFVTLSNIWEQDYVRTARSKGLHPRQVMNTHVMRNALVPILTTLGVSLRFSLSSLPVVEFFFSWPGAGFTLLKAISQQDDNLTVALIFWLGAFFIFVNILLDVGYRLVDPRLRLPAEHLSRRDRGTFWNAVRSGLQALVNLVSLQPLRKWWSGRNAAPVKSPFAAVLAERGDIPGDLDDGRAGERRAWLKGTLGNAPLILGAILVAGLLLVILFGPSITPLSPYTTQGMTFEGGQFRVPPFPPDDVYRLGTDVLGRDILSLILAGAQQTILLTAIVVLARILIGFTLGALAGWFSGSWLDRTLMGAAEALSAFPTLLLAMILILALGIREGIRPFVIALCFLGWGETMQFVRSEVMSILPKLYIESAIALGMRTVRIILIHVLPNLIPAMISIAALEMGAVLMLLGELGFIGIFIGGGAYAELDVAAALYHYSDVPEWGALLSNIRPYARAYTWTALYPSLAFFVAILGFNLFGEGLRRMVEVVGVRVMRLFNRFTLAGALLVVLAFVGVRGSTGALAVYKKQAQEFDGKQALLYAAALAHPAMEGRALGSAGLGQAAQYIANQFETLGLQAAGDNLSYFQPRSRSYLALDTPPRLVIEDGGPELAYRVDYAEYPALYRNIGEARAPVRVIAMGELASISRMAPQYLGLQESDYSDEILLLPDEKDVEYLGALPRAGVLVVADDSADISRRYTLAAVNTYWARPSPAIWISVETADRILKNSGRTVADLRNRAANLGPGEVFEFPAQAIVSLELQGETREKAPANHVLGYWPGTGVGGTGAGAASKLDDALIVVMAQYDSAPMSPDGVFHPGAVDNASGVAVMLEAIRAMRASGYQPYKTFLFVAYSAEGQDGGEWVRPEVSRFLQTKFGFETVYKTEAIVQLRGVGAQGDGGLVLLTGGSLRLADLFASAAQRMDVPVMRSGDVDISIVFEERAMVAGGEEAPTIGLAWDGWEDVSHSSLDTLQALSPQSMQEAGRALSLALMILGRETGY